MKHPYAERKVGRRNKMGLEAFAGQLIEKNRVPYAAVGFADAFENAFGTELSLNKEEDVSIIFNMDVSKTPDCGNIADKCVEAAFKEYPDPKSLMVLRAAKISENSVQNFAILVPRKKGLADKLNGYKSRKLTPEESHEIGQLLKEAGAVQVDATPWYETTTSHQINKIHEVIIVENIREHMACQERLKRNIVLDKMGLITRLDKHDVLWLESYVGVPTISLNMDNTISYTPQINVRGCRTVVDKDEARLVLAALIPDQKRLKETVLNCTETETEKIFDYLRAEGVIIPKLIIVKKNPKYRDYKPECISTGPKDDIFFIDWKREVNHAEEIVFGEPIGDISSDKLIERLKSMQFRVGSLKTEIQIPEFVEETHNYPYLKAFAQQGSLEAALVRNLKGNYGALIGVFRTLPATLHDVQNEMVKSKLLINLIQKIEKYGINQDTRIMGSDIRREVSRTLERFPDALTSYKGTRLWEHQPMQFPLTNLVEKYSLVRSVVNNINGAESYCIRLVASISKTEENKGALIKHEKELENMSNDNVEVSVCPIASPSIYISTPFRIVGEDTRQDIEALIPIFCKVEEKIKQMAYELK